MQSLYDVIIIGGGAAGMMCAATAGGRGRRVCLIDHAKNLGEKIRISGGGRCNFTNIHCAPDKFLSANPHFCKSALSQYTQYDFIDLVKRHNIAFHEKKLGQLFCDQSSKQIINMLSGECKKGGVDICMETSVTKIEKINNAYIIHTNKGTATCQSLVIATGGLSIPKIGASKLGYDIARRFDLNVLPTRAGLVPLTFQNVLLDLCKSLTGLSADACISFEKTSFAEGMLFTHRGLSGPSILQISSYWKESANITVNLVPECDVFEYLKNRKISHPKQDIETALSDILPKRLAQSLCAYNNVSGRLADLSHESLRLAANTINAWEIKPDGTEGYRTAEVTLGGVDTNELSSKTMECKKHAGLFFIGEVVDVTGHLGGFNFQWAWSSGYVAGQHA